jgi:hypothetical protein
MKTCQFVIPSAQIVILSVTKDLVAPTAKFLANTQNDKQAIHYDPENANRSALEVAQHLHHSQPLLGYTKSSKSFTLPRNAPNQSFH